MNKRIELMDSTAPATRRHGQEAHDVIVPTLGQLLTEQAVAGMV